MTLLSGRLFIWCGVFAAFSMLVSFVATSAQAIQDRGAVAELTANMKTVCVGKLLIDLPDEAQVSLTSTRHDPSRPGQGQDIVMSASLPSHPDISIKLVLSAGTTPGQHRLPERSKQSNAHWITKIAGRGSTLRAQARSIAGLAGDERAERVVDASGARAHNVWWESRGSKEDVLVLHVVFTMNTGSSQQGLVPSSLSDGAALVLWDKLAAGLRVRRFHCPAPCAAPSSPS